MQYQRVSIPLDEEVTLYGFVALDQGVPQHTYCCSLTPSVFVQAVGYEESKWHEEQAEDGYFSVPCVLKYLKGQPFEADDEEEAREEAQGNWS